MSAPIFEDINILELDHFDGYLDELRRQLIAALRDIQTVGFMDQADLQVGQPISEFIRTSISSADVVLVLISPTPSHGVLFELGAAQALGKK